MAEIILSEICCILSFQWKWNSLAILAKVLPQEYLKKNSVTPVIVTCLWKQTLQYGSRNCRNSCLSKHSVLGGYIETKKCVLEGRSTDRKLWCGKPHAT